MTSATNGGTHPRAPLGLEGTERLLLAAIVVGFAPAVLTMAEVWDGVDYASHGYLVPIVAVWAAVRDARRLRGLARQPDGRGLALLAAAIALYAVGLTLGTASLQGLALVASLTGAVWWRRGVPWLRALAFPLGFLLFMVPLPDDWVAPLILRLRLLVTEAAVALLHVFDVPVAREGNVLLLPGGESLFVADACSGITSIVTLTPLAVLLAYFTERTLPRRLALVATVVPISLGGNLVRVVVTVLAALQVGVAQATESVLHESAGLLTYVLGCLALLAAGALLRRLWPER
jgi:exosortase